MGGGADHALFLELPDRVNAALNKDKLHLQNLEEKNCHPRSIDNGRHGLEPTVVVTSWCLY